MGSCALAKLIPFRSEKQGNLLNNGADCVNDNGYKVAVQKAVEIVEHAPQILPKHIIRAGFELWHNNYDDPDAREGCVRHVVEVFSAETAFQTETPLSLRDLQGPPRVLNFRDFIDISIVKPYKSPMLRLEDFGFQVSIDSSPPDGYAQRVVSGARALAADLSADNRYGDLVERFGGEKKDAASAVSADSGQHGKNNADKKKRRKEGDRKQRSGSTRNRKPAAKEQKQKRKVTAEEKQLRSKKKEQLIKRAKAKLKDT